MRRTPGSSATSGANASSATQSTASSGRWRADVGDERQRVDDVAQRRRPDDEDRAHRAHPGAPHPGARARRGLVGRPGRENHVECALFNRARSLGPAKSRRMYAPLPMSLCVITRDAARAARPTASRPQRSPPRPSSSTRAAAMIPWKSPRRSRRARDRPRLAGLRRRRRTSPSAQARPRLGALSRRRRARDAGARARDRALCSRRRAGRRRRTRCARRNRFLGRWLRARRGLPRLERAAVRPPPRALDRRSGARARRRRRPGGARLPATCCTNRPSRSTRTSPSRTATRRCRPTAMHARGERAPARCGSSLSPVARFLRFYVLRLGFLDGVAGTRAHRDRLLQQLHEVRQAARAAPGERQGVSMRVLVTGAAGFIGMHVAARLLDDGAAVIGVDNFDPYYDVALKEARLARLSGRAGFAFRRLDLADDARRRAAASATAASPTSSTSPRSRACATRWRTPRPTCATTSTAFGHVLEGCRHGAHRAPRLRVRSSSVYGANHTLPFSEDQSVDHPVSLYAATKKADELMAHSYSHLYRAADDRACASSPSTGPGAGRTWRRCCSPARSSPGEPIKVFNHGRMRRDFTYVDDIVEGVVRVLRRPPAATRRTRRYAIYNIGNHEAVELETFIATLERLLGRPADARSTCRCRPATSARPTRRSTGCARSPASRRTRRSPTGSRASSPGIAGTTADRGATPRVLKSRSCAPDRAGAKRAAHMSLH